MSYSNVDQAYILPQPKISLQETMQNAISLGQRQAENQADMDFKMLQQKKQDAKNEQEDYYKKLGYVNDMLLHPEKYDTGVKKIDKFSRMKMGEVYNDIVGKMGKMPIGQIVSEIQTRMQPIFIGDAQAKRHFDGSMNSFKEYAKINKNFDLGKASADLEERIANNYFEEDGKGGLTFKSPDKINPNTDIVGEMLDPKNRWKYATNKNALQEYIKNDKGDERNYFFRGKSGEITHYQGGLPVWMKETVTPNEQGYVDKKPEFFLDADEFEVKKPDGKVVKVQYITEDKMRNILNTDEKIDSFNALWEETKAANGWDNIPPDQEQKYKGALLADVLAKNSKNKPTPKIIQQPQKWQVTNNVSTSDKGSSSSSSKSGSDVPVRQLYDDAYNLASNVDYSQKKGKAFNRFNADFVSKVMNHYKNTYLNEEQRKGVDDSKFYIRSQDGQLWLMNNSVSVQPGENPPQEAYLMPITKDVVDIGIQPTTKGKNKVISKTNAEKPKSSPKPQKSKSGRPVYKLNEWANQ